MRPLQVYLDSSDYSDFGKALAGRGTSANLELAQQLRQLADSGRVEFRFSIIHVIEAAPIGVQHLDYAKERGVAIEYLSGKRALEPWQRLPALELMGTLSGDTATPPRNRVHYHARNDEGHWFPPFESALAEIRADAETRLRDPLAAVREDPDIQLTRELRRKINRESKSGRAREAMLRDLSAQRSTWLPRLRALIPVSKQHEALWLRYFKGKAKIDDVSNALRDDLSDIAEAMAWLTPAITSGVSELPKWLRGSGESLMQLYAKYRGPLEEKIRDLEHYVPRTQLERVWEEESPFGKRIVDPNWLNEAITGLVEMDRPAIEKSGHSFEAALAALNKYGNAVLPSMATYSALTSSNLQKNFSPFEQGRSAEKIKSDVGDIFHAVYMPYVDVMRIDGFAEQYMRPVAERWNTTLVTRRHDLPKAIEQVLSGWQ
jgi:hypothetical protein